MLTDQTLPTNALCVRFLVCDPSGLYETGEPVVWHNRLVIRNRLFEEGGGRTLELRVAPGRVAVHYGRQRAARRDALRGTVRHRRRGRAGARLRAAADGLEAKAEFRFPARGKKGPQIDDLKPACLVSTPRRQEAGLARQDLLRVERAREKGVTFEGATVVTWARATRPRNDDRVRSGRPSTSRRC